MNLPGDEKWLNELRLGELRAMPWWIGDFLRQLPAELIEETDARFSEPLHPSRWIHLGRLVNPRTESQGRILTIAAAAEKAECDMIHGIGMWRGERYRLLKVILKRRGMPGKDIREPTDGELKIAVRYNMTRCWLLGPRQVEGRVPLCLFSEKALEKLWTEGKIFPNVSGESLRKARCRLVLKPAFPRRQLVRDLEEDKKTGLLRPVWGSPLKGDKS